MTKTALRDTVKCSEPGCDGWYASRGLCSKHYKQLLGREGGYARDYAREKSRPGYKKMKEESDKKYRDRLRDEGTLSDQYHRYYTKALNNPEFVQKKHERAKTYYASTKESRKEVARAMSRRYRDELKLKVLTHYSNGELKCNSCGIPVYAVLTLDHIDNNGADHKRSLSKGGKASSSRIYKDILDNNYPPHYQVLCFNCNYLKEFMRRCDVV